MKTRQHDTITQHSVEGDDGSWLIANETECWLMGAEATAFRKIEPRDAARWWIEQNTPTLLRRFLKCV